MLPEGGAAVSFQYRRATLKRNVICPSMIGFADGQFAVKLGIRKLTLAIAVQSTWLLWGEGHKVSPAGVNRYRNIGIIDESIDLSLAVLKYLFERNQQNTVAQNLG
ncbi:MAG: hypothetical protein IK115_04705 [Lachnospiraceae bacterium]|nr:hypothetical protein [Lachnospiraceae bacterium]